MSQRIAGILAVLLVIAALIACRLNPDIAWHIGFLYR